MWPKILLELLPHFTRVLPLADKYFSNRGDQDKAQAAAFEALGEEMRGGLGRIDEIHAGLKDALKAQGEQIAELGAEGARTRMAAESAEARVAKLENSIAIAKTIAIASLVLLAGIVVMLIVMLVKLGGR